jgi:Polyketide cyclase / dehydrase and lipid transport
MAKRYDIEANAESSATIDAVWRVLVNQQAWPTWAGFDSVVIELEGSPTADGIGSVRRTKLGRTVGREEVTRFDEPHTYGYRLLSGLPVSDYESIVLLTETQGGTRINWHSTYREKIPFTGAFVAKKLQAFLADMSTRLATAAAGIS